MNRSRKSKSKRPQGYQSHLRQAMGKYLPHKGLPLISRETGMMDDRRRNDEKANGRRRRRGRLGRRRLRLRGMPECRFIGRQA